MKNKKVIAFLLVFSLLQLIFPVAVIAYEKNYISNVIEKGEAYTLRYTQINHFNKAVMWLNTDELYTVTEENRWQEINPPDEYYYDTVDMYPNIGIEKAKDGSIDFFDADTNKNKLTDYNWFHTYDAFDIDLENYEFTDENFGLEELFELGLYLCEDEYNDTTDFEKFMQTEDGSYNGLHHIELEGKIVLSVYKGFGIIKEFYIGDELILRHK